MDLRLNGKVAIITGGSEGIGRAAAASMAAEGVNVVVCARRQDVLEQAAREISSGLAGEIVPVAADVSRAEDVARLVETTVNRFGRLDILVNNAGTSRALPFENVDDGVWQEDIDLKLYGAIRTTRLAIPHLRAAGGGSIVNVLNIGAKQPGAASVPTSVSRAAGMALTKALSKELGPDNIRVNAVLIGLIKSGQHERRWRAGGQTVPLEQFYEGMVPGRGIPLGRVGEAAEAGDLITYLCSPRAAYITGVAINMDGGASGVV